MNSIDDGGFIYLIAGKIPKELISNYRVSNPMFGHGDDEVYCAKVGFAKEVRTRFNTIQSSSFINLRIVAQKYVRNKMSEEKTLHQVYYRHRLRGEWFRFTHDELLRVAERILNI